MKKVAVVYWSGTGNTETMAQEIAKVAKEAGADVSTFSASDFDVASVGSYDALAFGCPAMGAEVLEEGEFEPMFDKCKPSLSGKSIALFGSYDWGDGEWMRSWEDDCKAAGAVLVADGLIVNNTPDGDGLAACGELAKKLS